MDKNSNKFVVLFQGAVCVVLAILLAGAYNALSDRIAANEEFDKQRNILKAVGLYDPATDDFSRAELQKLFETRMRASVLEIKRENREVQAMVRGEVETHTEEQVVDVVKTDLDPFKLKQIMRDERKLPPQEQRELVPFYTSVGEGGDVTGYVIPISGYGLWSTLYGYLALEPDLNTVKGITFYKHGETPGLGGEVDNANWQRSWAGKQILEAGNVVSVALAKGAAAPGDPHAVDGLSGATITSNGVTRFVRRDLVTYEPYFEKLRQQR